MNNQRLKKILIELKEMTVMIFCIVLFMTFIMSHNKIPSGSMIPTLNIEDRLIISMLPYYYRAPQRGEMVVFNGPDEEKWIKRVIGLPGETVEIKDGNVYINDEILDESTYLSEKGISGLNPILDTVVTYPYTIPEDCYFLLGDNRLESYDCRYIGAISQKEITGKAIYRVYPFNQIGKLT
ncbi:MAG: signal peptidase I [Cellulosilyticum sp.]|nr:signal peptidase I [Cellulosilyticum sp.]